MNIRLFPTIVLIFLLLCGCGNSVASSSSTDTKTMNSGNNIIAKSNIGDLSGEDDIDAEPYSDIQFFVIDHARISYDPSLIKKNDRPGDYFDIASPYENYEYYEDGDLLEHQVAYQGNFYVEHWEKDENGNITEFDGRTGDDRIAYMYDDNNRLIQEWRHRNYWPSSVTIYEDYDEHGNYGSTIKITSWGGSIFKQGDPWYDLDYIDYEEVKATTHRYYTHEYDEKGRLISTTEKRHDGRDEGTHTYEYDSRGNLVYEYDSGDEYIREYHSNGEIALLQKKWRDELEEETVYDSHGNPIKNIDDGKLSIYENEYDKYGNLVRQYTYNEEGECKYYDIWQYVDKESYLKDMDTCDLIGSFVPAPESDVNSIPSDSPQGFARAKDPSDGGRSTEGPNDGGDLPEAQSLFNGLEWFEGVIGCKFNVPEGFTQQTDEGLISGPGMYRYSFRSDELDMNISVFECTFLALPITAADVPAEYKSASSAEGVTYAASGTGYYVVSGTGDDDSIYYTRVDYNEDYYASLSFDYPTENGEACEKILLEFLKDYSAG